LALVSVLAAVPAQSLQAPAESRDYQGGGTLYEPLMEFVYELDARSDLMSVQKVTETLMGRDIVLCALANPPVRRPADALNTGRPIVLIVNNVHGSEVAGKDASMELMRDLLFGDLRPLLDRAIVLVVPTINPDGAEVGRRTNEQGFDLNRDYLKQESQEISALVTKVINPWQPHLHVDTHHGGSAPYTLVYQTCMNPAGDAELVRFGNEQVLPNVRQALRAEDYDGFWYSGPRERNGQWEWNPTSVEPRKQHVYTVMANMVGFLFESPSSSHRIVDNGSRVVPIPREDRYRHQVRGQYLGLQAMVRFAAERGDELIAVVADAKRRATRAGGVLDEDDEIVLAYEQRTKFDDEFWVRDREAEAGYAKVTGAVRTLFVPTKTATRPLGYFLPPQMAKVVPLLLDHEISVQALREPVTVEVEALYATEVAERSYYQGHYLKRVTTVSRTEEVAFPAGTFYVPMAQPRSNLIAYLLEPETEDSLATWNHLDDFIRLRAARPEAADADEATPDAADAEARARFSRGRRGRQAPGQSIPIYRSMQPVELAGSFVEHFATEPRRRYVR